MKSDIPVRRLAALSLALVLCRPAASAASESLESLARINFLSLSAFPRVAVPGVGEPVDFTIPETGARATDGGKSVDPDWGITPGRLCATDDPDFAEYRYAERVPYCKRNVSVARKKRVAQQYGVPWENASQYEFDHLIPVCVGGSSLDDNIWPQPRGDAEAEGKDKVEAQVCAKLRAGTMTQAQAVKTVLDWFKDFLRRRPAGLSRPS
ncbi:MAG: hypothetical protein HY927_09915 [Elusimicrobia bacterium]|nr:hypothetical protein [Elusimicrobiota bacterium]